MARRSYVSCQAGPKDDLKDSSKASRAATTLMDPKDLRLEALL